jgi:hypothetical protein
MSSTYDIQGRNCLFQIKIDDVYQDVLCAKTFSFNRTYELKETTTVQSGYDKEFRPRKKSYTLSFNGVVQVEAAAGKSTIKTLFDYGEGFLPVNYRLIYEDNSGNVLVIQGEVYLSSAIFNANPINLLDGTIEMQGTGPIVVLDEVPDLATLNIVCTGDASITALVQFKLFNANGDTIFDSGQLPEASGGNLTHPFSVSAQIQKGDYSYWWQVTCDSIGNAFQLDAPPTASTIFNDNTSNDSTFGVQEYDFTANRTVTFTLGTPTPPPACVAPSIPGSPTLHDGQVSIPWATSFPISGSAPFGLTINNRPSWMAITIVDNGSGSYYVQFAGTPDTTGTGVAINIDITNACGTVNYSDTIDVAAAPVTSALMKWEVFDAGSGRILRIYRNAVLAVEVTTVSSGQFTIDAGDAIEVQLLGPAFITKHLAVLNETDSITMYDSSSILNRIFSFTAVAAKQYYAFSD